MRMKHIDITFDFETVSTAPDAAPMSLGAIVWLRDTELELPFTEDSFSAGIDLRSCVVKGFSFDQDTIAWWSRQNETAKYSVTKGECLAVADVFCKFFDWVEKMQQKYGADTVCLWCQGQDFDFPILKTIARKFSMAVPVHQHYFRDCRTFVLETAALLTDRDPHKYKLSDGSTLTPDGIMAKPMRAYDIIPKIKDEILEGRSQHDALYDCLRSTWSVWNCMKLLKE